MKRKREKIKIGEREGERIRKGEGEGERKGDDKLCQIILTPLVPCPL
jgi:hypothetical protein